MAFNKSARRQRIRFRIRKGVKGSAARPRLSVFRSNSDIYAQLIDDLSGKTLAQASSAEKSFSTEGTKTARSFEVGKLLANRAQQLGIQAVTFDRGGYLYHGRVKALADGAREGGLNF
jgi:large subunit ribosomal protein L18